MSDISRPSVRAGSTSRSTPAHTVKQFWAYLRGKFLSFGIGHLLLILLGLHLFAMSFPSGNNQFVFDEAYYVPASRNLLAFVASNPEHPFFGKIWGALGIFLFGNDFFGYRIFYVIIGVLTVWVFYELALVFLSRERALFAASFLGFETLFFIHTSLLLLEGPPLLFGLAAFLLYFKKHYYLSAIAFGLSVLSKEWGVYFIAAFILYHLITSLTIPYNKKRAIQIVIFVMIIILVVGLPLWTYDAVYHPMTNTGVAITNPVQNFEYYANYQSSLKISPGDANNTWDHFAWGWINPFIRVNPSVYYATTITVTIQLPNGTSIHNTYHPVDWVGVGNLVIWYSIWAIIPLILVNLLLFRKQMKLSLFVGVWIAATYLPSIYLSAFVHRVVYAFYFINVDPALALGIPLLVALLSPESVKTQRIVLGVWLAAAIVFFILFFPVHPLDFAYVQG
ncbi:MAG: glycosyltransferase family 39 protein [Nitrososphaerales archaeon]